MDSYHAFRINNDLIFYRLFVFSLKLKFKAKKLIEIYAKKNELKYGVKRSLIVKYENFESNSLLCYEFKPLDIVVAQ